jgi:hypothetical protein
MNDQEWATSFSQVMYSLGVVRKLIWGEEKKSS